MSRRKSQRALVLNQSASVATGNCQEVGITPEPIETFITVTGTLFDGTKISQHVAVKHIPGKSLGEVIWTAIEVIKRIGGLIEDIEGGMNFYPLHVFEGGMRFVEKAK